MYTNVPGKAGTINLTIQGDVWQPVEVKPSSAAFSRLTAEAAQEASIVRKLTIINNMEQEAHIADVRSTSPMFHAEVTTLEPGKKFELVVSLVPPLKPGNNQGKIELTTGVGEMPTLAIPVRAYVTSPVDVMPPKLTLAANRSGDITRQFFVSNNTKTPVKISDIEVTNPAVKVALQETKPGMKFKLTADIPADYQVSPGGDYITFKTDCPGKPEVKIPILQKPTPGVAAGEGKSRASRKPRSVGVRDKVPGTLRAKEVSPDSVGQSDPATGESDPKEQ